MNRVKAKKPKKGRVVTVINHLGEEIQGKVICHLSTQFAMESKSGINHIFHFTHPWVYKNKK